MIKYKLIPSDQFGDNNTTIEYVYRISNWYGRKEHKHGIGLLRRLLGRRSGVWLDLVPKSDEQNQIFDIRTILFLIKIIYSRVKIMD